MYLQQLQHANVKQIDNFIFYRIIICLSHSTIKMKDATLTSIDSNYINK